MTIKAKAVRVLTWALGAVLVSAGVAWAANLWRVDSYGNIKAARSTVLLSAGQTSNCRIVISGSTLSVTGNDGNALSVANPCVAGVKSPTSGLTTTVLFTVPVSVTFGAASDTDGNTFGVTSTADWSSAKLPMMLQIAYNGSTAHFGVTRIPLKYTGAAATALCQKGDADCDNPEDLMLLTTGATLADFVDSPITQVGWFYGQWASGTTSWTFSHDTEDGTGFNLDYGKIQMSYVTGQMGNDSGKYYTRVGGTTALAFTTYVAYYYINSDGWVRFHVSCDNQTANGAAGAQLLINLPFKIPTQANAYPVLGIGGFRLNGTSTSVVLYSTSWGGNSISMSPYAPIVNDNSFPGASDAFFADVVYQVGP